MHTDTFENTKRLVRIWHELIDFQSAFCLNIELFSEISEYMTIQITELLKSHSIILLHFIIIALVIKSLLCT